MQLTPFCLALTCLRISPDRSQFFRYDSISLTCEDELNSTTWKVKRKTLEGGLRPCSFTWGSTTTGSTCIIGNTYPSDSGVYWCESEDGESSNTITIIITDRTVILESPALPVAAGASVILRCKAEMNSSNRRYDFYKDDLSIGSSLTGEMTIHNASKSDEGLYKCSVPGGGESVGSWLAVEASTPPSSTSSPTAAPSSGPSSGPSSRLLCHLMVGTPYLLSTILLGLIYRDRKRAARTIAQRRGNNDNDIVMEIVA